MLPVYKNHGKRWCWRHIQMPHIASMPQGELNFNKIHIPSGYVVIEDVIRFLITDLGVKPPCGSTKWHQKLVDSEKNSSASSTHAESPALLRSCRSLRH